jgi:hypothetical protein
MLSVPVALVVTFIVTLVLGFEDAEDAEAPAAA